MLHQDADLLEDFRMLTKCFTLFLSSLCLGPNVAAEWLAFLLRIQKVLALNLASETCYPD
jgi:hypothetical protein